MLEPIRSGHGHRGKAGHKAYKNDEKYMKLDLRTKIDLFLALLYAAAGRSNGAYKAKNALLGPRPEREDLIHPETDTDPVWIFNHMRDIEQYGGTKHEEYWHPARMRKKTLRSLQRLAAEALLEMRIKASVAPDSGEFDPRLAWRFDWKLANKAMLSGSEQAAYIVARFIEQCNQPEYKERLAHIGAKDTLDRAGQIEQLTRIGEWTNGELHRFIARTLKRMDPQNRYGTYADEQPLSPIDEMMLDAHQMVVEEKYGHALKLLK
ncbi:MAG: hypothetical protein V1728_02260 [Candidatus Micrarchaeota archaeon]